MGDDGGEKAAAATGIKQIARLRELLHNFMAPLGAKQQREEEDDDDDGHGGAVAVAAASAIPPLVLRRLQRTETAESVVSDDESCQGPDELPPADVPRGYCPVYVGPEQRRFVIPTRYLAHPVFRLLLDKAEEEFGFSHQGALAIPCEIEAFKYILQCVERHDDKGDVDRDAAGAGAGDDEAANHPTTVVLEQEPAMMHHS